MLSWRSMAPKLPAYFLLATLVFGLGACATPLDFPAKLANVDHHLFALYQNSAVTVPWVDRVGASYIDGDIDAKRFPRLANAWESGHAPTYGLLGQQHTQSVREVGYRFELNRYQAYAKVLSPHPSRVWLISGEGEDATLLARGETRAWGEHAHYIELSLPYSVVAGDLLRVHVTDLHGRHAIETAIQFEF